MLATSKKHSTIPNTTPPLHSTSTSMSPQPTDPIIIIGAGVLGLTVACTLLSSPTPPSSILLIAHELPTCPSPSPDYASPWAGAHYRPIPATSPQLRYEERLAKRTAATMLKLADAVGEEVCGVGRRKGVEVFEKWEGWMGELSEGRARAEGYAYQGDGFRVLDRSKGEVPKGAVWGCEYATYCVNTPVYLRWLLQKCQGKGVRVVQQKVASIGEAWEVAEGLGLRDVKTVVDCSGRGVAPDAKVNVIRGQTVLVRKMAEATVTRQGKEGWWSFLIPRPGGGGTIVGGTKEVGDWEAGVRIQTREELLRRAKECFPDFFEGVHKEDAVTVVKDVVGRRPWREGGLRIEAETLGGNRRVVFGYGAGGRGYELSVGAADEIVKVVQEDRQLKASL